MENWPPQNGESSTTPQSTDVVTKGQTSSEQPSNRVIMLLGLDPNTTTGMISKAFREHGLQVTVDYQRDDTIGYVQLYLDIAKEVSERIMSNGGLRIGTDVAVLRALEVTARSSPGNCKTSGKVRYQRRNNRQNPYQIMELEDGVDTLSSSSKYIRQNHQRMAKPQRRRKKKSDKTLNKSALKKTKASTKKRLSFIENEESTANTTPSFDTLDDHSFDTPSFGTPPFDTSPFDVD
ncbi:10783_t:CDS:2 [Diversispora eburnea]|uniref:10783_t:CDS:1 n=1 Tax=Diversispora eburnea TaxID=1213867 RepID=A0A9N9AS73_9GLOM|nr:10783_t:CDS:2 [Diversispora eburnea]